jgi:hypothetical protein
LQHPMLSNQMIVNGQLWFRVAGGNKVIHGLLGTVPTLRSGGNCSGKTERFCRKLKRSSWISGIG